VVKVALGKEYQLKFVDTLPALARKIYIA
jgi:hypothetical protein